MLRHLVRAEHLGHDEGGDDQQTGAHRYPPRPPTWCWPAPDGGSSWWDRMSGGPSPSCPMPVDQPLNCSPCLLMGSQRVVFTISVVKTSDRCTVLRTHVQARSPASATCSTRPSAGVTEPRGRQRMRQELRHGPLWRLVPDSGLNVRLCLMRARCASATNPVAPGTASVIPPTKTQQSRGRTAGRARPRGRALVGRESPAQRRSVRRIAKGTVRAHGERNLKVR